MSAVPRTLFVIINDSKLVVSEPDCLLYHDQWFLKAKLVDENMARRFIDQHVRGYYRNGEIHFYRCPTFIYDDQDIAVFNKHLPDLISRLKLLLQIQEQDQIGIFAGSGATEKFIETITV